MAKKEAAIRRVDGEIRRARNEHNSLFLDRTPIRTRRSFSRGGLRRAATCPSQHSPLLPECPVYIRISSPRRLVGTSVAVDEADRVPGACPIFSDDRAARHTLVEVVDVVDAQTVRVKQESLLGPDAG